jgi:uncharacterized protein
VAQQQWGGAPPYGQPPYRQPGYPPPAPGASPYGRNPYAWGSYGQPQFGRPAFGGPQFNPPQYGPPPRAPGPRRRSPLRQLLVALIGISVLALGALAFSSFTSEQPDVAYQNDDYQVPPPDRTPPPLPLPDTYEEATALITRNPVYDQMAPLPVRCNSQPINVRTASDDQLEEHFGGLMECLVRFWQPPVTSAGFLIVRPTVTVYGKELTTKCGTSGVNAFYCSADQQVYYSNRLPDAVPIVRQNKWAADVVMAHEFGHAVQARTAILISSHALGANANDESVDLEFSRRLETQADCFSGMFVRGVSQSLGVEQSDLEGIQQTYTAVGDDTLTGKPNVVGNHGRAKSRKYWGDTGLGTSQVGDCNTFVASPALVR